MDKQYRIGGFGRGQLPISGSVKRWQILSPSLGDDAELVIGHPLEHGLLNQRLADLKPPYEGALVQNAMPCPVDGLSIGSDLLVTLRHRADIISPR